MTGLNLDPAVRLARKATLNAVGDLRNNFAPSGLTRNKKPKRWSHQDELNSLKGRRVTVTLVGYNPQIGILVEADQFAIKFQAEGQQSTVTYFKHTIEAYAAV